jgi:murein L,D-transpeptidase YcbB/YkuD
VGPQTRERLNNQDIQKRIQQIIVTMERWRWVPDSLEDRHIIVNIAAFMLQAYEGGNVAMEMPVIIGKNYRKTPLFLSHIYAIRFNPSWHVPYSIAVKDKLPKIRNDPDYLSRGNYVVYDGGTPVDPHSIDWSSVDAGDFSSRFRLRQTPGSHNALGKIRFSIDSPYNVYLHDTNEHQLFEKSLRNLSSGCIRVSKPQELAAYVFNNSQDWSLPAISQAMDGHQTRNIPLKKPVSVLINYFTVWQDQKGIFHFSQDIYGQDAKIWTALQQHRNKTRTSVKL